MIKDIPADFTLQELVAFIEGEQTEVTEGHHTAREWAEHFGVAIPTIRRYLARARRAGRLRVVETTVTSVLTGRASPTWAYAFQSPEEEET